MNRRKASVPSPVAPSALLGDIRALIEAARKRAASTVNSELTMLYWRIGQRIRSQVLDGRRGAYGKEVLPNLAAQLVKEYGGSFAEQNLRRMVQFAARCGRRTLTELGAGFSFVARQKRIQIDGEDFHLDLLFYNRKLRRLAAVELKVGEFKAAFKGQMERVPRTQDRTSCGAVPKIGDGLPKSAYRRWLQTAAVLLR